MPIPLRSRWLAVAAGCMACAAPGACIVLGQDTPPAATSANRDSLLAAQPKTPEELFRAVLLTLQLDRPDVARRYLDAFVAGNPDDELLLKLRNEYGTATFAQFARTKELQPVAQDLLVRVRQAALDRIHDPAIVDVLIDRLSGLPRERGPALVELKHLRSEAVPHLLRRYVSQDSPIPVDLAVETLAQLGSDAVPPLVGALQTAPDQVATLAAEALGRIAGPEAEEALWSPAFGSSVAPSLKDAARMGLARILHGDPSRTDLVDPFGLTNRLRNAAERFFRQETPLPTGDDGRVAVWFWSAGDGMLVSTQMSPQQASLFHAEIMARQAIDSAETDRASEVLLLAVLLARDAAAAGWDQPIPEGPGTAFDLALTAGPDMMEAVLRLGIADQQPFPALGALKVLGRIGSRQRLSATKQKMSAVQEALNAGGPRVQFAAADTILRWDPVQPFADSARVVEILSKALQSTGRPDSVVIDPNTARAILVGDYLSTLGYEPRIAGTGRAGFQSVVARGDVAVAIIHLNAIQWELSQTIANLRADARTRSVPIAIYGPLGEEDRARFLEQEYPRITYISEANTPQQLSQQLRPFLAQLSPPPLSQEQRDRQREQAVVWLERLAIVGRTNVFNLAPAESALSEAVNVPSLSSPALTALSAIPTATAEERLLDSALNSALSGELRAEAARRLATHVQHFGLLLSPTNTARLRDAAQDDAEDPAIQTALDAVMGSLGPDAKLVRERLLSFPASAAPSAPHGQ